LNIAEWAQDVKSYIGTYYKGNVKKLDWLLVAILNNGHILLEDVPGVGKTLLAGALGKSLGLDFARIQCTPDITPGDILGVNVYNPHSGEFTFRPGPIETSVLLVDEINRATPRSQSALLEAMAEGQVSHEGQTRLLPQPFFLIATENPVEFEGTFPLPEAQKDRFFLSFSLGYTSREVEKSIITGLDNPLLLLRDAAPAEVKYNMGELYHELSGIRMEDSIVDYIMDVVASTRHHSAVALGVSPRGGRALVWAAKALAAIRGRNYVLPDDVKELTPPVFRKRLIIKTSSLVKGLSADKVLNTILENLQTPALKE
jgi:MoxR-like ATPase